MCRYKWQQLQPTYDWSHLPYIPQEFHIHIIATQVCCLLTGQEGYATQPTGTEASCINAKKLRPTAGVICNDGLVGDGCMLYKLSWGSSNRVKVLRRTWANRGM